jgi:AraC-like DNA-binding protein
MTSIPDQPATANNVPVYSTLAAWPLAICQALLAEKIDPLPLLKQAGLNKSEFESDPDQRVDIKKMSALWEIVEEATNNSAFGLNLAKFVQPTHFRSLGMLMLTCSDMEQALQKLSQYHALISNTVNIQLSMEADRIGFIIQPIQGIDISPMAIDAFFATLTQFSSSITGQHDLVIAVELIRSQPSSASPWQEYFGSNVKFDQPSNCLWFNREKLLQAPVLGEPQLASMNEQAVIRYLEKMNALSWHEKIKNHLLTEFYSENSPSKDEEPSLIKTAQAFNLSERTLRRYLAEENSNFRSILQETRMTLADLYLQQDINITDIALRLGFSDSSNFSRAFQRWFGHSPSQHFDK